MVFGDCRAAKAGLSKLSHAENHLEILVQWRLSCSRSAMWGLRAWIPHRISGEAVVPALQTTPWWARHKRHFCDFIPGILYRCTFESKKQLFHAGHNYMKKVYSKCLVQLVSKVTKSGCYSHGCWLCNQAYGFDIHLLSQRAVEIMATSPHL